MPRPLSLLCFLIVLLSACNSKPKADLILYHGRIYTMDSAFSIVEAVALKDGRILAAGTDENIRKTYKTDSQIDLQGRSVYPGFIDAHSHFTGYGRGLFEVNLFGSKTWDEAVDRVKKFAAEHPSEAWIRGRGWDQNLWPGKAFPDGKELSRLFPDKPVLLQRVDGHAAIANDAALRAAGVDSSSKIEGGVIEVKDGKCTGLLVDNAVDLVTRVVPEPSLDDYRKWLTAAEKNCFAVGLTTVSDCGVMPIEIDVLRELHKSQELKMRVAALLSDDSINYARYLEDGPFKTDRLFVTGFKVYADGALGSRGACLLHPYSDQPGWSGFLLSNPQHFDSIARRLEATKFQMCTHAIGDSANRIVLKLYNQILKGPNDRRWRIEHAQVIDTADIPLFGETSIIPSVQPTHATSDMYWAQSRLGKNRMAGAYAYRHLLGENGWMPLGTDFPVEDISPFRTFYAAVVRKDASGFPPKGFQMGDSLNREQALRGMTIWAAKSFFLEDELGSLEPGKRADFVITSEDLMKVDSKDLLKIEVVATYLDGERVFQKK